MKTYENYDSDLGTPIPHSPHMVTRIENGEFEPSSEWDSRGAKCSCGHAIHISYTYCPKCGIEVAEFKEAHAAAGEAHKAEAAALLETFKTEALRDMGLTDHPAANHIWNLVVKRAGKHPSSIWSDLVAVGVHICPEHNPPVFVKELEEAIVAAGKLYDTDEVLRTMPNEIMRAVEILLQQLPLDDWYRNQLINIATIAILTELYEKEETSK